MTDMIDLDDEEAPGLVAKPKRSGDRVIVLAGFVLATAAAFFPWYVFFNQESFGIAPMGYTDTRDLPETPGRPVVTVSPLAIPDEDDGAAPASAFDPIVTATVPAAGDQGGNGGASALSEVPNQSFPRQAAVPGCCMSPMAVRSSRTSPACILSASARCCPTIPVLPPSSSVTGNG